MRVAIAGIFTTILLAVLCASTASASDTALAVGQRWSYETRPGEGESTLVIGRLENHPTFGEIAHISIFGLSLQTPQRPDGVSHTLGHIPISVESLRSSLLELVGSGAPDENFEQGYAIWSEVVQNGEGGVFSIPVREVISYVEETLNQ